MRRPPVFVALDAGTGGGKCAIFDATGRCLAAVRRPWSYRITSHPEIPFVRRFDFDPETFWSFLCECTRRALESARVEPQRIAGVAATSQREGCVFLDREGREVMAAPNLDARGFAEGLEVLEALGPERLYEVTGHSAPFIFPLVRYLWYRKQGGAPVRRILMLNDWIVYRLSGAEVSEPSNGTESLMFDLRTRNWSREILEKFDIPSELLPPVGAPGEVAGRVHRRAARETGLPEGLPVYLGGADTQCSLLGAGAISPGQAAATLGTTAPLQIVTDRPTFDPKHNLWAGCHVLEERWVLESNIGDTGDAYRWLLELLGKGRSPSSLYRYGEKLAGEDGPPPEVFSFVGPSIFDTTQLRPDRPGGILFPFPGLHVRPSAADIVRAFLDSIGFAIRANYEQLLEVTGTTPGDIVLSGGLTRNEKLLRRCATILGRPLSVTREPESAALGCAILVARGSGVHPSTEEAVRKMVRLRTVEPEVSLRESYQRAYERWKDLSYKLSQLAF
ncbi:MAG: autoinducer-2 kinase [Candidatus Binatia bacterium]|nr:MAG: autoinducer-2 kinase [Candidatus Binatia bacterium]